MALDDDLLLDLIQAFYDAALEPTQWPRALERLSDAFGGVPVHFGIQRLPQGMPWLASVRRDPIYHRLFQERYAPPRTNPVVEASAAMHGSILYPRHEFLDDATYHASEMYHEILRPQGQGDFALAILLRATDYVVPFSIYRRIGTGSFSDTERRFLDRLLPHVGKCLQIQLRLESAAVETAGLAATLDHLPFAVLLLGAGGRVLHTNGAADRLLRAGDGLAVRGGRVTAATRRETDRLDRLIGAAAATGARRGADPGGTMALSRPSLGQPLSVLVAPLPAGAMQDRGIGAAAVMMVREPGSPASISGAHLIELYGLTGAEARVATALLAAGSLREVAAGLGVGVATVRTHLHRLFDKTGARRQAELVRLLTALMLP